MIKTWNTNVSGPANSHWLLTVRTSYEGEQTIFLGFHMTVTSWYFNMYLRTILFFPTVFFFLAHCKYFKSETWTFYISSIFWISCYPYVTLSKDFCYNRDQNIHKELIVLKGWLLGNGALESGWIIGFFLLFLYLLLPWGEQLPSVTHLHCEIASLPQAYKQWSELIWTVTFEPVNQNKCFHLEIKSSKFIIVTES